MKLTVLLKLKLLDELVELNLRKVDLPRKDIGTLMQSSRMSRMDYPL